jgi:alkanesulfonate monooxygenase SsuD/methylene tetrahydromethanopterin reductase-like flavin-dependent oxidoreductase (luciferase family)
LKYDVFFSICQTPVDGYTPSEKIMFQNFFDQAILADELGYGCAWVAETHLSCQVQKRNPGAVIPHFEGEIGLNTDILQLAHVLFARTKQIAIGSAIRNIQCNGGPIAHAESIKMFMSLHDMFPENRERRLEIGFAAGRFPFSNAPYGLVPRDGLEKAAWPALRGLVFQEATEIFLRLLKGEILGSEAIRPKILRRPNFRSDEDWHKVLKAASDAKIPGLSSSEIPVAPFWKFDPVGVIPFEAPMGSLRLTIGAHDAETQNFANTILPVGVFNLSITPSAQIEETHQRMQAMYNSTPWGASDGLWSRALMPRTVLVFIDENREKAKVAAARAVETYWKAVEGTLDPKKVSQAVDNAIVGDPREVAEQMSERYHDHDRLMLWFDFNNHDNEAVKKSMRLFMEKSAPFIQAHGGGESA